MIGSVVTWIGSDKGHRCGYCKDASGSKSEGLWAYSLTPMHYQLMIDRGWRRSGQYCYQPRYRECCCQLYTIRCLANELILTKSMRSAAKRVNDFLVFDKRPSKSSNIKFKRTTFAVEPCEANGVWRVDPWIAQSNGVLEQLLSKSSSEWFNTAHTLTVLLVKSWPPSEFYKATYREEHLIYVAYQCSVHKDPPAKVDLKQFAGFLVETPFADDPSAPFSNVPNFGAYHMQFRIDNRLVAVSVIDILPYCVSSVYCFYDPAFTFLNLGTFTALYEIALARTLHGSGMFSQFPDLNYYYMGFYIHNCKKMKYKGQFRPASLLCPESMRWFPIEQMIPVIENTQNKYTRLDPDPKAIDEEGEKATAHALGSGVSRGEHSRPTSSRKTNALTPAAARLLGSICSREFKFV